MYNRSNEFHHVESMVNGRVQIRLVYEGGHWRLKSRWSDYYHDDEDDDDDDDGREYYGPMIIELKSEGS